MPNKTLKIVTVVVFTGLLLTFVVLQSEMFGGEEILAPGGESVQNNEQTSSDSAPIDSITFERKEDQKSPQTYSSEIDEEKEKLEQKEQDRIRAYSSKSMHISTPINPKALTPLTDKQ